MSKNATKYRNKWFDDDYDAFEENHLQTKRKKSEKVEVRREKNKTKSNFRQPTYENLVSDYGNEEDWY